MTTLLLQLSPPPFSFEPQTWFVFLLANAIIMAILGRRLLRDVMGWFRPTDPKR